MFKLDKINKEILALAIPNILSNVSVPLLSSVDTGLMGHLSTAHLAAIGLASMVFNFIYWNFGFLRMGTTGITAQAYGAQDVSKMGQTIFRALMLGILLGILLILAYRPMLDLAYLLLNVDTTHTAYIGTYVGIRVWAAPATFVLYVVFGWLFGMQNAVYPLILTLVINLVNILLSSYLVIYLDLGIAGAAWGTVAAQYVGLFVAIGLLFYKYNNLLKNVSLKAAFAIKEFIAFLSINKDLFIRTVFLTLAFGFFYSQSSKAGALILASNIILLQFINWMSYAIDGFAFASESLVGKFYGGDKKKELDQTIKYSFYWGAGLALLISVIYYLLGGYILRLFTDEPEVINFTEDRLWWMFVLPLVAYASYIWDGIYIGFYGWQGDA